MKISKDYSDFTLSLFNKAVDVSASDEIVILALRHASNLSYSEHEWKILDIHKERIVVQPFYHAKKASEDLDWDTAIQVLQNTIENCQSEWLSLLYLLKLYWIATSRKIGSSLEESTKEQIVNLISKDSKFQCYSSELYYYQTTRLRQEGDFESSLEVCEMGIRQSKRCDDQLFTCRLIWLKAELLGIFFFKQGSIARAKKLLKVAREIAETLNDSMGIIQIQSLIQVMSHLRSEYSMALELNFDNIRRFELIGEQPDVELHNVSVMYNEMGNGKEALEWAFVAQEGSRNYPLLHAYTFFDVAWAYINLNKLDEAIHYLNLGREKLLREGIESMIAIEYTVNGLLERARGNYASAFDSLERAMEINRRNGRHNRVISCLIKLAETEVLAFQFNSGNYLNEVSGKWMAKLEKCANKMDLPGVKGLVKYLLGELRLKQGRLIEAQERIEEVLRLSDQPGLEYLKDKKLVQELLVHQ